MEVLPWRKVMRDATRAYQTGTCYSLGQDRIWKALLSKAILSEAGDSHVTIQLTNEYNVHEIQPNFFPFEKANYSLYLGNNNCYLELDEEDVREKFQTFVKVEREDYGSMQPEDPSIYSIPTSNGTYSPCPKLDYFDAQLSWLTIHKEKRSRKLLNQLASNWSWAWMCGTRRMSTSTRAFHLCAIMVNELSVHLWFNSEVDDQKFVSMLNNHF